jgi:hypothetical protein
MTNSAELNVTPPSEPPRSAAAARMRVHRERRRLGLRCLTIQLRETEVAALVHKGMLDPEMRNDPNALAEALYEHLDRTLDARP